MTWGGAREVSFNYQLKYLSADAVLQTPGPAKTDALTPRKRKSQQPQSTFPDPNILSQGREQISHASLPHFTFTLPPA